MVKWRYTLLQENVIITHSDVIEISPQSKIPCNNGTAPTVFSVLNDRLVPIKNRVSVSPVLDTDVI